MPIQENNAGGCVTQGHCFSSNASDIFTEAFAWLLQNVIVCVNNGFVSLPGLLFFLTFEGIGTGGITGHGAHHFLLFWISFISFLHTETSHLCCVRSGFLFYTLCTHRYAQQHNSLLSGNHLQTSNFYLNLSSELRGFFHWKLCRMHVQ